MPTVQARGANQPTPGHPTSEMPCAFVERVHKHFSGMVGSGQGLSKLFHINAITKPLNFFQRFGCFCASAAEQGKQHRAVRVRPTSRNCERRGRIPRRTPRYQSVWCAFAASPLALAAQFFPRWILTRCSELAQGVLAIFMRLTAKRLEAGSEEADGLCAVACRVQPSRCAPSRECADVADQKRFGSSYRGWTVPKRTLKLHDAESRVQPQYRNSAPSSATLEIASRYLLVKAGHAPAGYE